ncbi:hypothetical protein BDN72DRAFT_746257, partial [Pluteus cervinus]
IFLGFNWLEKHNPLVTWAGRTLELANCKCSHSYAEIDAAWDAHNRRLFTMEDGDRPIWIDLNARAMQTKAQELAEQSEAKKNDLGFDDVVPPCYHEFRDVFEKESFDQLPE